MPLSWILNGYTVAFAALLAPAGRLADRYDRQLVFLIGVDRDPPELRRHLPALTAGQPARR